MTAAALTGLWPPDGELDDAALPRWSRARRRRRPPSWASCQKCRLLIYEGVGVLHVMRESRSILAFGRERRTWDGRLTREPGGGVDHMENSVGTSTGGRVGSDGEKAIIKIMQGKGTCRRVPRTLHYITERRFFSPSSSAGSSVDPTAPEKTLEGTAKRAEKDLQRTSSSSAHAAAAPGSSKFCA